MILSLQLKPGHSRLFQDEDSASNESLRKGKYDPNPLLVPNSTFYTKKPRQSRFLLQLKVVVLLNLLFSFHQTSSFPVTLPQLPETVKYEHLITKRDSLQSLSELNWSESFGRNNNTFTTSGESESESNTGSRSKRGNGEYGKPSFGQLVILAQEEAKCLQQFGGQPFPTPSTTEDLYNPVLCSKTSNQFAQCEICRNITTRTRTRDECLLFCGKSSSFCTDLCVSINKAVSQKASKLDVAIRSSPNTRNESFDNFPESKNPFNRTYPQTKLIFSQSPQVFCEGVTEKTGALSKQLSTEVSEGLESESWTEITNHFIVLKWILQANNGENITGESSGESNSTATARQDINSSSSSSPVVFIIEKYSASQRKWEVLGKTLFNLQQIGVTYLSDTYKWRVTAVGPNGILDKVTSSDYKTLNGYVQPGPPREIYIVKTVPVPSNSSMVKVLIGWQPPEENACSYKIVLETHEGADKNIRIREPLGVHHHWFNLLAGTQYSIRITTRDPSWEQFESNLTRLDFQTPTCLQSYNYRFDKCAPPSPRGVESKILENSRNGKTVGVSLDWKPPQHTSQNNPILFYNVTITRLLYKNGETSSSPNLTLRGSLKNQLNLNGSFPYLNLSGSAFSKFLPSVSAASNSKLYSNSTTVSGNTTHLQIPALDVNAEYQIMVHAVSISNRSSPPAHHLLTTAKIVKEPTPIVSNLSNWLYLAIPVSGMLLLVVACNMGRVYLHKRQVKIARNQYFQSMEDRDASGDWSIVPLTDETYTWKLFDDNFPKEQWQIVSENLIMGEVIGQGAFGVVRRAKISRKKLQSATLKYLDKASNSSPYLERCNDEDMETVAVKMLKVSATREDREQLVKEIMTMQSLGFHPQIVGLLGACTHGRSLSLVLEYCSGGDLLSFIRKVRAKYWPTLGLSEAKNKNTASSSSQSRTTTSYPTGSISGGSGTNRIKNTNSSDCNNESEDNSPINYADLDHFSDYSSSLKSEHLGETQPLSPNKPSCQSLFGKPLQSQNEEEEDEDDFRPIDEKDVLSYARQIAMGMEYLEKSRIVHRDLACRNCLLMGDHRQVKLSDFGLSRDIYTWNVYHQKSNGKLPIKWMAIESIFTHVFTTKSDVWSYGILLWELVTLGGTPYPGLGNTELFHLLKSGYRKERPDNCSEELYALMKKCWRTSPAARPNFTELRNHVQNMMEAAEPNLYLSLMADIPSDYFRLGSRSDLLPMNETTDGGSGNLDFFKGTSTNTNRNPNSKKYAGYHNTHTTYPASKTNNSDQQSADSGRSSGLPNSNKTYSRSNSTTSSSTNGGKSSANSSVKFTLDSVPEGRSKSVTQCELDEGFRESGESPIPRLIIPGLESESGESTTNFDVNQTNGVHQVPSILRTDLDVEKSGLHFELRDRSRKMKKSSSTEFDSRGSSGFRQASPTTSASTSTSPTSTSLQFPYPFRQVNSMTIIENKSYGLTDD